MATLDVFRGRLRVGEFCAVESDWTFRVYDDGTLHVDISRPENWRERHADSEAPERLEKELEYSYVCYEGVARHVESDDAAVSGSDCTGAYSCEFCLAKCAAEGESWTVRFEGTLLPSRGFQGHWTHESQQGYLLWPANFDEDASHAVLDGTTWSCSVEPGALFLAPLTCGTYSMEGSLMDDENAGFIVPMKMELELFTDGRLAGSSLTVGGDDPSGDVAELSGSWTRDSVEILCVHRFQDSPDEVFALYGTVSRYKIIGVWAVEELEALGGWENSDHQRFHMRLTRMCRPWTREEHQFFPSTFKTAVRLCLLSSLRSQPQTVQIPSVVWPRVFSFCSSSWFEA